MGLASSASCQVAKGTGKIENPRPSTRTHERFQHITISYRLKSEICGQETKEKIFLRARSPRWLLWVSYNPVHLDTNESTQTSVIFSDEEVVVDGYHWNVKCHKKNDTDHWSIRSNPLIPHSLETERTKKTTPFSIWDLRRRAKVQHNLICKMCLSGQSHIGDEDGRRVVFE